MSTFTVSFSSCKVSVKTRATINQIVDIKISANSIKEAVNVNFPNAFYSYTIRPDCIVFYDSEFGKIYCKI